MQQGKAGDGDFECGVSIVSVAVDCLSDSAMVHIMETGLGIEAYCRAMQALRSVDPAWTDQNDKRSSLAR
jgi:hypothetical protein